MAWFSIEESKLSMEYSSEGLRLAQKPSSLTKQNNDICVTGLCGTSVQCQLSDASHVNCARIRILEK